MKQEVILVLDCGATNVRAIAVDRQGKIIARAGTERSRKSVPTRPRPAPGRWTPLRPGR